MTTPTDRGYAVIATNADGTMTVQIATGIERGRPVGVYAKHVHAPAVRVDPAVRLSGTGTHRFTTQVVEVFTGADAVIVRAPRSLPG